MTNPINQSRNCPEGPRGIRFFFPLLAIPIGVALLMGMAKRKRHYLRTHFQNAWVNGVPPMFAEWHRRAHESQPINASPGE